MCSSSPSSIFSVSAKAGKKPESRRGKDLGSGSFPKDYGSAVDDSDKVSSARSAGTSQPPPLLSSRANNYAKYGGIPRLALLQVVTRLPAHALKALRLP